MVSKALKPTKGNADQITMNIVSVTSATSRPRSPSAGASAARPGEGPVNPVAGSAAPGAGAGIASSAAPAAGAGIASSAASEDSAHVGAVGEAAALSGMADAAAGPRGEVGGFGGFGGAGVGAVRFGSAARGEGVAARLTLADFARGHSGGLGPGAAGAMEMARSAAPSDAWLGQAG